MSVTLYYVIRGQAHRVPEEKRAELSKLLDRQIRQLQFIGNCDLGITGVTFNVTREYAVCICLNDRPLNADGQHITDVTGVPGWAEPIEGGEWRSIAR